MNKIFGKTGEPINGSRVLKKPLKFNDPNVEAVSWVVIDDENGVYTTVNSYNGRAGTKFNAKEQCYPITPKCELKWLEKGYKKVPLNECPLVKNGQQTPNA